MTDETNPSHDAAIEAAAKAHYELGIGSWEAAHADTRAVEIEDMRIALEAAMPHMLANAWDACVHSDTPWINPYRKDDQ